jgi:DNA-binding PadR family transcriptional regulator
MRHEDFGFRGFGRHGHGHGGGRGGFFGRFGGGGGFMGAGMRAARMFASGDLQLIILALLSEKPRHGYDIIKELEERSSGLYTPSPGVVYPALTYLEEAGFAVSEADGNKKLFKITEAGSEHFAKNKSVADEALENLALFGQKMAKVRDQMASDEAEDEKWAGGPRDQVKKEWRQMKMEFHEIKHDLKAAIFEKLHAPMEEKKRVLEVLKKAIAEIRKN